MVFNFGFTGRLQLMAGAFLLAALPANAWTAPSLAGHTRSFTQDQQDLGAVDADRPMHLRLWLKPQRAALLNSKLGDLLHPLSTEVPSLAPFQSDAAIVEQYLLKQGFKNVKIDPSGRFVTADASALQTQKSFGVQLHDFLLGENTVSANTANPVLDSSISGKVSYIGGLTTHSMHPMFVRPRDIDTGRPFAPQPFVAGTSQSPFNSDCFRSTESQSFKSTITGILAFLEPHATAVQAGFSGNRFGAPITDADADQAPCGYTPAQLQKVYGVNDLVKAGLDGSGQTVVIVDAYGSPTLQGDLKAFSDANGLPPANLTIYYPSGGPVAGAWAADKQAWAGETTLDVEWAHVMAPGAKIALVVAATANDDDLTAAIAYAVDNNLGNVISNSWGSTESQEDQASMALFDIVLKAAAAKGIAVNVSSGDNGDEMANPHGGNGYVDVDFPTSSPLVTSVGGTSLGLGADQSVKFHLGWGNNAMRISDGVTTREAGALATNAPLDPPTKLGFVGGSGGGTSRVFAKPSFQNSLPGNKRMIPDIAFLADPYTGVEIIQSSFDAAGNPQPGKLTTSVIGGTSLACPMFSALWAIANQAHGSPLGQAAALLYNLPPSAIIDVVPVTSGTNVTGSLTDSKGTTQFSALQLGLPQTEAPFITALYNSPKSPYRWNVISFGTDSSLETTVGWDNVTGLGIPNGYEFVRQFMKN